MLGLAAENTSPTLDCYALSTIFGTYIHQNTYSTYFAHTLEYFVPDHKPYFEADSVSEVKNQRGEGPHD